MDSIREQVIDPPAGPASVGAPPASAPAAPLVSTGDALSRLAAQLELLRQRQGLDPGYRIHSHRRLVGFIPNLIKRVIHWAARPYVDAVRQRQEAMNEAVLAALREASIAFEEQSHQLELLRRLLPEARVEMLAQFETIEHDQQALKEVLQELENQIEQLEAKADEVPVLAQRVDTGEEVLRAQAAGLAQARAALEERLAQVDGRLRHIEKRDDVGAFFNWVPAERRLAAMNANRGTFNDIMLRQREYLDLMRDLPGRVLDLGCGRGEMINLLRIHGVECWGAEIDPLMVEEARRLGVHVVEADALSALRAVAPGTLGGLFAAQVAEHFRPGELLTILRLARERLAPGGRLLFETLNPSALGVLAKSYYRDLEHKQPLHPEYFKQLVELAGFARVELHYLSPFRDDERLAPLAPAAELGLSDAAHAALQERLDRLNDLLYGCQDYYILAEQGEPAPPQAEDEVEAPAR